jgi:hypothetical protein
VPALLHNSFVSDLLHPSSFLLSSPSSFSLHSSYFIVETRSLPTRSLLPRSFAFYVAHPTRSILPSHFQIHVSFLFPSNLETPIRFISYFILLTSYFACSLRGNIAQSGVSPGGAIRGESEPKLCQGSRLSGESVRSIRDRRSRRK